MEQREIEILKSRMEQMSDNELQAVVQYAETVRTQRSAKRQKELWGNVVSAIRKYQDEVDDIIFQAAGYEYLVSNMETPGEIMLAEE